MELSSPLICFNVWSLDISVVSGCFKISLSGTWAVLFRHWAELSRYLPASIISPKFAEIIWYCHPPRLQTRDTSRANKHPQLCIIRQPSSSSTQVWVEQLAADPRSQGIKTWETWGGSFARSSGRRCRHPAAVSVLRHAVISPVQCSALIRHPGRLYTREEVARLATTTDHVVGGCLLQPPAASHNQLRRLYLPTFNPLNAKISSVSRLNKLRPHWTVRDEWKVELIAKVLGWYQTRDVTLLYEALNIPHAKNNWVQFLRCHLSRIEIYIVLFAVKIA